MLERLPKPLTILIVSDVMCPWCYIGKRRLEKALAMLPDVRVSVHWRPFLLDATIPEGGMDRQDYLTRKFGMGGDRPVYDAIRKAGLEEGIPFAFEKIKRSPNTIDAHRLLHWADEEGKQDAVAERLFQLYFLEGADAGDKDVLADAAADAGMDRDAVRARLDTDESRELILKQVAEANDAGIDGVPCFIFEGKSYLPGAQKPELLAEAITQAVKTP